MLTRIVSGLYGGRRTGSFAGRLTAVYRANRNLYYGIGSNLSAPLEAPRMPSWNTSGRPTTPELYSYGFNIDINATEVWNGSTWV